MTRRYLTRDANVRGPMKIWDVKPVKRGGQWQAPKRKGATRRWSFGCVPPHVAAWLEEHLGRVRYGGIQKINTE